jgi:uncharacterized protein YkwD
MRAVLYLILLVLIFAVGARVEDVHVPALFEEIKEKVATLPQSPTAQIEEEITTVPEASEPPPLLGAEVLAPPLKQVEYTEGYTQDLEKAIHDRINVERVREGLGVLAYDEKLAEIAAGHSTDMAKENYFAHEDEKGCTSACRLDNAGYKWRTVGENLFLLKSSYHYSVEEAAAIIVAGWMGSEGHRHNVLNKSFTHEGLGVVIEGNSVYATELFARPR